MPNLMGISQALTQDISLGIKQFTRIIAYFSYRVKGDEKSYIKIWTSQKKAQGHLDNLPFCQTKNKIFCIKGKEAKLGKRLRCVV